MKTRALVFAALAASLAATCDDITAPDTCVQGRSLTIGTPVVDSATAGDCRLDDKHGDSYAFTLASQTTVKFNMVGAEPTLLRVRDASKTGDAAELVLHQPIPATYNTFVVLPAGSYIVDVAAVEDEDVVNYTLGSSVVDDPGPVGCVPTPNHIYAAVGVTVSNAISTNDCFGANNAFYADAYLVKMNGARTLTITGAAGINVEIHDGETNALITHKAQNTAGTNVMKFIPPKPGYYVIGLIGTPDLSAVGAYTLKIE
jgi:hypothetical protein